MKKMRNGCAFALIATVFTLLVSPVPLFADYKARYFDQTDGIIYQYKDEATTGADNRTWQIWVPISTQPIRGLLVDGNPGTGNGLATTLNDSMQAFAQKFNFGIMASSGVSGGSTYSTHSFKIVEALEAIAALGINPELVNVPFVTLGNSSAGANAYGLAMRYPERTICFTANVIASINPTTPSAAGLKVPGIFVQGEVDNVVNTLQPSRTLLDNVRPQGALWGRIVIQGMRHEHRRVMRLFYPMWEKCIRMRLPESWDPLSGPPTLLAIDEENGWLVDDDSSVEGTAISRPATDYDGDKTRMSWYLDADMAQLARGYGAYEQYGEFSINEVHNYPGYNNIPPPALTISQAMDHFRPGTNITLVYSPEGRAWQKVSFYYGAELLAELTPDEEPTITIGIPWGNYAQAYTAVVVDDEGNERPLIGQGLLSLPGRAEWISAKQFGWYYEGFAPWYYHADLGWIFPSDEEVFGRSSGYYVYYWNAKAWFWIRPSWMPWGVNLDTNDFVELPITPAP